MADVVVQVASVPALSIAQGLTRYAQCAQTKLTGATTEASAHRTVLAAGTFSKMWLLVVTNDVTASSTVRFRKNGADGNQVITVGASTTGEFIDDVNTDVVVSSDEVAYSIVTGAGGTTLTLGILSMVFAATTNTYCFHAPSSLNLFGAAASTTYFFNLAGGTFGVLLTAEANHQQKMKSSGTLKNFTLSVVTNTRTTDTIYRSRKNGADGNCVITVAGSATGLFEDTTNSDAFASGDLLNYSGTTGTGTGDLVTRGGAATESTDGTMPMVAATNTEDLTANSTYFLTTTGELVQSASEAPTRGQINSAFTASKLELYLSANTVTAESTFRLRINGVNGNQVATIAASTTGWFEDVVNTDTIVATDEINYSLTAGATGTSLSLEMAGMLLTAPAPPTALPFITTLGAQRV